MSFTFYGNVDDAVEMSGCEEDLLTNQSIHKVINMWIDKKIRKEGFAVVPDYEEYFNVDDSRVNILMLTNIPVITDSLVLTDNAQDDVPTVVDSECYILDMETGIIQLLSDKSFSSANSISYFTKGIKSVKAKYNYGYVSVPDDVSLFATLLLAKWGKVKTMGNSNADGLKQEKTADYTRTFDLNFMSVSSEYDDQIKDLFHGLKVVYNKGA